MTMAVPFSWITDGDGLLCNFAYHDGVIIQFDASIDSMAFRIKDEASRMVQIELFDVVEYSVLCLWRGAIVSDIYVWRLKEVPGHAWDVPGGAWSILFDGRDRGAKREVDQWMASIPDAYLVQLECSYGGRLAAVCKGVNVYKH
jgi:hypothetical protein